MNKSELEFVGTDVSLEISLMEYGLICAYNKKDNDWFCVYSIGDRDDEGERFDCGHKSEMELDKLVNGEDWMSPKDCESFLSYVGSAKEQWFELRFVNKLHDLISYYGYENIMGTSYTEGMTVEEVTERYLN